jgi:hypothetical protein
MHLFNTYSLFAVSNVVRNNDSKHKHLLCGHANGKSTANPLSSHAKWAGCRAIFIIYTGHNELEETAAANGINSGAAKKRAAVWLGSVFAFVVITRLFKDAYECARAKTAAAESLKSHNS